MKLLVTSPYYYYGSTRGIEPQFYYLYKVPLKMGIDADFFDYATATRIGLAHMRRIFLSLVRGGAYDVVFLATHLDEFDEETLQQAKKYCQIVAWNSDDEVRWENYSQHRVEWYSAMVTNDPITYRTHKQRFPTLHHAQWACTGLWDGRKTQKNIDVSFVGQVYGTRERQIAYLMKHACLQPFGKGTGTVGHIASTPNPFNRVVKTYVAKLFHYVFPAEMDDTISFEDVNHIWNRTRISFTPLESAKDSVLQIKSRVFDMGLSGTLPVIQETPLLHTYYEPNKEYIPFTTMEECVEKIRYFMIHEKERKKIADAYAARTQAHHLWKYRIGAILKELGIRI